MDDHDLRPHEAEALRGLARERAPGPLLEERTVRALRARGLLAGAARRHLLLTPPRLAAAAGLLLALLAGAFALGQWSGSRQTARAMLALQEHNDRRLAASLQRAGTSYVVALSALAGLSGPGHEAEMAVSREVAQSALYAAADEMARIFPDDPVASRVLWAFEHKGPRQPEEDREAKDYFIWF